MVSAPDMVKAEWAKGNMPEIAPAGDVVWSDSMQEGYVRVRGVPKNDKATQTYQLWIFDETQDPKTPIDGGTFDVTEDREIVIPINAKLKARNPKAFAITMEKPGGVVVSKQEKVPALAQVKLNQT
jgi:anti-sigma-K factor RskA